MGLFGNKKKNTESSYRTLTEKEIQARLYGHLREPGPAQEDLPSLSKPKLQDSAFHKTSSTTTAKTLTPSAAPSVHKPSITAPELFEAPESEAEGEASAKTFTDSFKKRESASLTGGSATRPVRREKTGPSIPAAALRKGLNSALHAGSDILKTVGLKAAEFLGGLIASVLRLFTSVNYKKPAVRRAVYLALGTGVLLLIFFGIHLLNVQREAAMKNPAKPAAVKGVSPKVSEPLQEETSADKSPETKRENTVDANAKETASKVTLEPAPVKAAVLSPEKSEVPLKEKKPAAIKKIEGPAYVVQVATFAAQTDAKKLMERFNGESLNAFIKPLSRSGGRVYYCVFLGQFKTHSDAEMALAEFKKKEIAQPFQDAFVRLMQ